MNTDYEQFRLSVKGLTNQEVIDEIYKRLKDYCNLVEEEIPESTRIFKEKLRMAFDKAARGNPDKLFLS